MKLYTAVFQDLIGTMPPQSLGPGEPIVGKRQAIAALTISSAFTPHAVINPEAAQACLAGLWLAYNFLDESHAISQDLDTSEGSYWHAILHRREPDYWNSKYWFRRVARHPVFDVLDKKAAELAAASSTRVVIPSPWDPFWFVDLCEKCQREKAHEPLARQLQQVEWELLFNHCYQQAIGRR